VRGIVISGVAHPLLRTSRSSEGNCARDAAQSGRVRCGVSL